MRAHSAGRTHVGRVRTHNEDSFLRNDALQLYVVADGMGGHAAGEVASWEAVLAVQDMVIKGANLVEEQITLPSEQSREALRRHLESAIQSAAYMVFGLAEQEPERKGMGTTITAIWIVHSVAVVASVGDSRAYLFRGGKTWQVTEDHTLVQLQLRAGLITEEQAKNSPRGNVITRAVGPRDYVQVDTFLVPLQVGDRYLLCSDGLHGYLGIKEISPTLQNASLDESCVTFIELANQRGGRDNITVVALELLDTP